MENHTVSDAPNYAFERPARLLAAQGER